MSKANTFTLLNDVKPFRTNWRIRVKLLHCWRQKTSFGGDTLECILTDESGVKIAASCKRNQMTRVENNLPIGKWKSVENFTLSAASGKYRPTNHKYKIGLTGDTVYGSSNFQNDNHFLSLAKYDDVINGMLKDYFLIDILGQVVDVAGVRTVQVVGQDRKMVQFRIRDLSGSELACCLWGKYVEQFETHFKETTDANTVCLIRWAKISFFRGEVQITNAFDASLLSINPDFDEAIDFKQKMLTNDKPLALIEEKDDKRMIKKEKDDWNDCEVRCISEILEATEVEISKIICSIESIDTDWGWFYFGCNRHNRRGTKLKSIDYGKYNKGSEKPLFYCEKCHANVSNISPKYKLHLFVKDDSASCKIMLLDSVAQEIIGNSATELWDGSYDEIEDPTILPQPIASLVGKSFCFGLSVSNDNVSNGADTYFVKEVWSGDMIQQIESATEPCSLIESNSSIQSGGDVSVIDPNKESSYEGISTPLSKRKKEEEGDLRDMASTSKKLCTKLIKMENSKKD